ncbi:MAG TPA: hypothetical protein VHS58_05680 [Acetobacteraceae bacterium]|nr:hypothetical protein [Acetobacteraceae bacterium]
MGAIPSWFVDWFNGTLGSGVEPSQAGDPPADVAITVSADTLLAVVGDAVTFTVTLANNGVTDATGLAVNVPIDPTTGLLAFESSTGSYDPNTNLWSVGDLPPGTATLTITAAMQQAGVASLVAALGAETAQAGVAVFADALPDLQWVSKDSTDFLPPPVTGETNAVIVTDAAPGAVLILPDGYQSLYSTGDAGVTLVGDAEGDAVLAGSGDDTLLSIGANDTLIAGGGDNIVVSFNGPAVETAAGRTGDNLFWGGAGAVTIFGGNGQDTAVMLDGGVITTGTGGTEVWTGAGNTAITANGADTIVGGSGAATVQVNGVDGVLAFSGTGGMVFVGGTSASTVVGASGSVTVNAGDGGGTFFGGIAGHNSLIGGSGAVVLVGGGDGDTLAAAGSAPNVLVASGGAETLSGAASDGTLAFFAGAGNDLMIAGRGSNTFTDGPGAMTVVGAGTGTGNLYNFLNGVDANVLIENFVPTQDVLTLTGFAAGAAAAALASATPVGGGTQVTLTDGTRITFADLTPSQLSASVFV